MKEDIRNFAKLGLVHHMLYPECTKDPDYHAETLLEFASRSDIETFDCCLPYGQERRKKLVEAIKNSGKDEITFAAHLFPFRKLFPASESKVEQEQCKIILREMIDQAVSIGAKYFIFPSGGPSPEHATERNYEAFGDFCRWLCTELKNFGITALLEPFDFNIDKKFLYGPTSKCVELIESLRPEIDNLGIELDVAHLPLMGETFEHAIKTCSPYLHRVHLGNCVLKDKTNPRYGDTHPPIWFPGGEIGIEETSKILRHLLETGFLNKTKRACLVVEMTPWPGKSVDWTIEDAFAKLDEAWKML